MEPLPRLNDEDLEKLTHHIRGLLEVLEKLPYPKVQEDVFELLNCIDHLHREGLTRLVHLIEEKAEHIKIDMANDYGIQTLMMVYDFVPAEDVPQAITASTGGGIIGLDQIMVKPIEEIKKPIWIPVFKLDEIPIGSIAERKMEGHDIVFCRIGEDEIYAYENACIDSVLPLARGELDGDILVCPWHGCHYDVRSGMIQNGSNLRLVSHPLLIGENGTVRIGFNVPDWMH